MSGREKFCFALEICKLDMRRNNTASIQEHLVKPKPRKMCVGKITQHPDRKKSMLTFLWM